jgi:hypothetical protein
MVMLLKQPLRLSNFLSFSSNSNGRILILPFFLCLSFLSCGLDQPAKEIPKLGLEEVSPILKEGDVILKCGYGSISALITKFLDEKIQISHCAIVFKNDLGEFWVAHSISGQLEENDGVQSMPLKKFLKDVKPGSFFVLRHALNENGASHIVSQTKRLLEERAPFDHSFDNSDTNNLYCSEFVNLVFKNQYGKDCFKEETRGDIDAYSFNSILENSDFTEIYTW